MEEYALAPLLGPGVGARRWLKAWAISFLVWTALWVYLSTPTLLRIGESGEEINWLRQLAFLSGHWVSALLTPLFLALSWRCPMDRPHWRRCLPRMVAIAVVFAAIDNALCLTIKVALDRLVSEDLVPEISYPAWVAKLYIKTIFDYAQIAAVGWAIHYQHESRQRHVRTSQLEARLAQAQVEVLRMQLQPHFLFNTLNAIAALMHRDVAAAERMMARLSDLLRHSLQNGAAQEVPLKEELAFLERYLDIERIRFQDRLTVERSVEPETLDALVPNLLLQPLVENAIRYGVAPRSGGGRVELSARRVAGELELCVADDGPGFALGGASAPEGFGVGIANTRARLAQLYGEAGRLELGERGEGGACVRLRLPWRAGAGERTSPAEAAVLRGACGEALLVAELGTPGTSQS
jgi:two-component system LytT family sensor kinase